MLSPKNNGQPAGPRWFFLLLLILAGESVFILPFVLPRVFRPTVLETFVLDNVQLGICFSVYGFIALVSYLFGGPLADKHPPRKLIAVALWMTALGGVVLGTFPGYTVLKALYGYWGFTTIFLFWAPMIKATRVWGGVASQGKAFGFLDGGRGLVGALFGALGVFVFALLMGQDSTQTNLLESRGAFRQVIWVSAGIVALMVIILCAYVGYKITDVFSLYAQDVMGYDQVGSAQLGTFLLFIRPVVGVLIGILADRTNTTWWLFISFVISFLGALLFASGIISASTTALFFLSVLIVATGVYAARALYFSVMDRGRIPVVLTGTAVGLISLVGYTPDIFAGPAMGILLEGSPGPEGHQDVFWMLSFFSLIGGGAAWYYYRFYGKPGKQEGRKGAKSSL
ncbi:MAG: MFS transporter [Robiginitalea sp.]